MVEKRGMFSFVWIKGIGKSSSFKGFRETVRPTEDDTKEIKVL